MVCGSALARRIIARPASKAVSLWALAHRQSANMTTHSSQDSSKGNGIPCHAYVTFKFQRKLMDAWASGGMAITVSDQAANSVLDELKRKLQVELIAISEIEWMEALSQ